MQGIRTVYDAQHGVVRYVQYDSEAEVNVQLDDPINLMQDGDTFLRLKLVDGELVYNRFGEGWSSVDEPLTQKQFLEVGTTAALINGQDINSLSIINTSGSAATLSSSSTVTLQEGAYKVTLSLACDFSNANGYAQVAALLHSNHSNLVSPAIKSSVYTIAQNLATHLGQNQHSFVFYCSDNTVICFRPSALSSVDSVTYFSAFIQRL